MIQKHKYILRRALLAAALLACLFCLALSASAATVFPERQTGPYRDAAAFARLDTELKSIMEKTRTQGTAADLVMGRIHDLAAGLRYPLASSDAIAIFLDGIPAGQEASEKAKAVLDYALQAARVVLKEDTESTRAVLRAIRDLRTQETAHPGPAIRGDLLLDLEKVCYALGVHLYELNKRCRDPKYTERVNNETMLFLNEAAANAAQASRRSFLDRLETDKANQDFIGGSISEKVVALRFPFLETIRLGFFLERLFEASGDETARQAALGLAAAVVERQMALVRLSQNHIEAIARTGPDDQVKQRLLREAAGLHQATLDLLGDSLRRYRGQPAPPAP